MFITNGADAVGDAYTDSAEGELCAACGDAAGATTTSTLLTLPPVGNLERSYSALGSFL